ncbi:hypothetical protein [Streptomyces sp. NPDC050504]|uniref:hypothetical protein n=1 Tax=Streptomyces sp. NPDC050504 TaxID=3365618 RepID=UPI0037991321
MYDVLRDSLPEFLGGLGTVLVTATASWAAKKIRDRHTGPPPAPPAGREDRANDPYAT